MAPITAAVENAQQREREQYLTLLVNITEITRRLATITNALFPEMPRMSLAGSGGAELLHGALGDVSAAPPAPASQRTHRVTAAPSKRGRAGSSVLAWVGEARVAYERAAAAVPPANLPKGARRIWDALTQRRTGPELTKLTAQKRKQVEKMIGVMRKQKLIETIDLREPAGKASGV